MQATEKNPPLIKKLKLRIVRSLKKRKKKSVLLFEDEYFSLRENRVPVLFMKMESNEIRIATIPEDEWGLIPGCCPPTWPGEGLSMVSLAADIKAKLHWNTQIQASFRPSEYISCHK